MVSTAHRDASRARSARGLAVLASALACLAAAPAEAKGFAAVVTHDAERLGDWYARAFDLKLVRTIRPEGRNMTILLLDGPLATVEIQERPAAVAGTPSPPQRFGWLKAGFQVDAVEPWLARWKAMDATILAGPFDDPAPRIRSVILRDPDGNSVHVIAPLAP